MAKTSKCIYFHNTFIPKPRIVRCFSSCFFVLVKTQYYMRRRYNIPSCCCKFKAKKCCNGCGTAAARHTSDEIFVMKWRLWPWNWRLVTNLMDQLTTSKVFCQLVCWRPLFVRPSAADDSLWRLWLLIFWRLKLIASNSIMAHARQESFARPTTYQQHHWCSLVGCHEGFGVDPNLLLWLAAADVAQQPASPKVECKSGE